MRRGGAVLAVVAALSLSACGGNDKPVQVKENPSTTRPTTPVTSLVPTSTPVPRPIVIENFAFSNLEVKAGTTLTIQNRDGTEHTFTADDKSFDAGHVPAKGSVQFTAPKAAGTYKVHCEIHSTMKGELKVS